MSALGDFTQAFEFLRKKGIASASAKSSRSAMEGLVAIAVSPDARRASLLEVNSETDFVARNDLFRAFVTNLNTSLLTQPSQPSESAVHDKAALLTVGLSADSTGTTVKSTGTTAVQTVGDVLPALIGKLGELIVPRRSVLVDIQSGCLAHYVHNGQGQVGQVGAVVALAFDASKLSPESVGKMTEVGKKLAMHVVAAKPLYVNPEAIPRGVLEKERAFVMDQVSGSNKPPQIVEKMIGGRLAKFYAEVCLEQQPHLIEEQNPTVGAYFQSLSKEVGTSVSCSHFVRYQVGEDQTE